MSQNNQKIVMTRPLLSSQKFTQNLISEASGLAKDDFFIEPVLNIESFDVSHIDFSKYDGVIITSSNAGEILEGMNDFNNPVYCVGQSYQSAEISCPTVRGLVGVLKTHFVNDDNFHFLYLRGEDISYDLSSDLRGEGFQIDEEICYRAMASDSFSDAFLGLISGGGVRVLTFFSKRSCEVFLGLAKDSQVLEELRGIKALCISQSVLDCCYSFFDEQSRYAQSPDVEGMKQLILRHVT